MKASIIFSILFLVTSVIYSQYNPKGIDQQQFIIKNYIKKEYRIPMRDGKTLFTAVYSPKDSSQLYPVMLNCNSSNQNEEILNMCNNHQ